MSTKKKKHKSGKNDDRVLLLIAAIVIMVIAILTGAAIKFSIDYNNLTATIEYSGDPVKPEITEEHGLGEINIEEEIPTVEAVESNMPVVKEEIDECPEGEECGMGSIVPVLNVSSPQAFANDVLGRCINVDNYAGSQCWDEMDAFVENYAKHPLYTCGTGAAKGTIENDCWKKNATDKFVMIWDKTKLQAGDIVVFSTGRWGHIGMAMGDYNNGYVTLLGQNQGGASCPGGGAAGNIINISLKDFIGAFRPKSYIKPEPKPEPKPTPKPEPKSPDSGIVK